MVTRSNKMKNASKTAKKRRPTERSQNDQPTTATPVTTSTACQKRMSPVGAMPVGARASDGDANVVVVETVKTVVADNRRSPEIDSNASMAETGMKKRDVKPVVDVCSFGSRAGRGEESALGKLMINRSKEVRQTRRSNNIASHPNVQS
jgi:hypothetical protein